MKTPPEKKVADKHIFADAFEPPVEVPAPELGPGVVVRFRGRFLVDDLLAVAATEHWREPFALDLLLARLTLIDAEGNALVDPTDADWFQKCADGVVVARLARRAGLVERFVKAYRAAPDEGEDQEELSLDAVRRIVADIATAMRLSPETIRSWPLRDLRDVLSSLLPARD